MSSHIPITRVVADLRRGKRPADLPRRLWFSSPEALNDWRRQSPDAIHYRLRRVKIQMRKEAA